jgi:hypothetical protein
LSNARPDILFFFLLVQKYKHVLQHKNIEQEKCAFKHVFNFSYTSWPDFGTFYSKKTGSGPEICNLLTEILSWLIEILNWLIEIRL